MNPEFKDNPNLIKPGQQIKLPGATKVETVTTPPVTSTPGTTTPPVASPTKPAATPPTPASSYTGSSVVDYLKSIGEDSSPEARARRAVEKGIVKTEDEYLKAAQVGANAQMNERLLKVLRG